MAPRLFLHSAVARGDGCCPTVLAVMLCLVASIGQSAVAADHDDATPKTVLKTQDGLRFELPADWPLEKRGGALGPIPVEAYLARKFAAIEIRLRMLEQQLGSTELRLRVLEESLKRAPLQSGEAFP